MIVRMKVTQQIQPAQLDLDLVLTMDKAVSHPEHKALRLKQVTSSELLLTSVGEVKERRYKLKDSTKVQT